MISRDAIGPATALSVVAVALRAMLVWWLSELASCVPHTIRRRISSLNSRLRLIVEDTDIYLADESGRRREPLGRIGLTHDDLGVASVERVQGHPREVTIRLSADHALRVNATLPLAAERNLDQVIGFEFERLSPFKREDVDYNFRLLSRDRKANRLHLELIIVQRAFIRDVIRTAQAAGLRPIGLEVVGSEGVSSLPTDLFLADRNSVGLRLRRFGVGALAALAGSLALAAVLIPLIKADQEVRALTARVATARQDAQESVRLQSAIDAALKDKQSLIERKRRDVPVVVVLDELSRLLPDDAWVTDLAIKGKELRISGLANSATSLLRLLDQSASFKDAAFRSPVTQDANQNRERFDIAAQITGGHQ